MPSGVAKTHPWVWVTPWLLACSSHAPSAGQDPAKPFPTDAPRVEWFQERPDAGFPVGEGNGLSSGDLDGDQYPDLVVSSREGQALLFRNCAATENTLCFEEVGTLEAPAPVRGVAIANVLWDATPEIILATAEGLRLFRVGHDFEVEDATDSAGVASNTDSVGVQLLDFDGDGATDIYQLNYAVESAESSENQLWRNGGDDFERVTTATGLGDRGASWVASSVDLGADDGCSVIVGNDTFTLDTGTDRLPLPAGQGLSGDSVYVRRYSTSHTATFVEDTSSVLADRRSTMGILVSDFNGDEYPDVYLSDYGANDLLVGGPQGRLELSRDPGLDAAWRDDAVCRTRTDPSECLLVSWGAAHVDFNLDGYRDLLVVNGATSPGLDPRQPAALWQGGPAGELRPVQSALGWTPGRGLVTLDADLDGDVDVLIANREPYETLVRVFETFATYPESFLQISLEGKRSNPEGLGAALTLDYDDGTRDRHWLGTGGVVHSWPRPTAYFGLGERTPTQLIVDWPSGTRQTVRRPIVGERMLLVEPDG